MGSGQSRVLFLVYLLFLHLLVCLVSPFLQINWYIWFVNDVFQSLGTLSFCLHRILPTGFPNGLYCKVGLENQYFFLSVKCALNYQLVNYSCLDYSFTILTHKPNIPNFSLFIFTKVWVSCTTSINTFFFFILKFKMVHCGFYSFPKQNFTASVTFIIETNSNLFLFLPAFEIICISIIQTYQWTHDLGVIVMAKLKWINCINLLSTPVIIYKTMLSCIKIESFFFFFCQNWCGFLQWTEFSGLVAK